MLIRNLTMFSTFSQRIENYRVEKPIFWLMCPMFERKKPSRTIWLRPHLSAVRKSVMLSDKCQVDQKMSCDLTFVRWIDTLPNNRKMGPEYGWLIFWFLGLQLLHASCKFIRHRPWITSADFANMALRDLILRTFCF